MGTTVTKPPMDRSRDRSIAAILAVVALAVPSSALAEGVYCLRVPPGRTVQIRVPPTDPTAPDPIVVDQLGPDIGGVGVVLRGAPEAAGTALIDGGSAVIRTVSPPETPELPSAPVLAVTISVSDQAPAGATVNLTSGGSPSGADSTAMACLPDSVEQAVAVAPPDVSITDVQPGGGLLPAGSVVAVVGAGFQPEAQVLIEGVPLASTTWVDSSRIEVVTAADAQLDGSMVSVTNPDLTSATSYASLRTTDLGKSPIPLLASTEAIFPVRTLSSALFAAPASGTFFALALQNPGPTDSIVSVELWDAGLAIASATLALPSSTKVSREVSELFPGVIFGTESVLAVTAIVPVQMLGISGNEEDRSVTPVLPALASP